MIINAGAGGGTGGGVRVVASGITTETQTTITFPEPAKIVLLSMTGYNNADVLTGNYICRPGVGPDTNAGGRTYLSENGIQLVINVGRMGSMGYAALTW